MKEEWKIKLKQYQEKFDTWYSGLAEREKQIVNFGGVAVGLLIIYALIYAPLVNHAATLRNTIQTEQKTLVWMQAADKQIQAMEGQDKNKANIATPVVMLSVLQKDITAAQLDQNLAQMKQASNDSIQLQFQKVSFDKLMALLIKVMKENKVTLSQFSVTSDATPGVVNADVMLVLG